VATGVDLSKHITLYEPGFGLNVTSSTTNVVAGGVAHAFTSSGLTTGSITMSGTLTNYGQSNLTGLGCANITCQQINTQGSMIYCGDLTSSRNATTGAIYIGSNQANYLYNDGTRFNFNTMPLVTNGYFGVGMYGVSPFTNLDVKVGANTHFISAISGTAYIGGASDNFALWQNLGVGGLDAFWPITDNALTLGGSGHRWKQLWAVTGTVNTSDARQKKNVQDSPLGLAFIESLHPVSYQWINDGNVVTRIPDYEEPVPETTTIDGTVIPATTRTIYKDLVTPTEGKRTHYGLIAQEVAAAVVTSGVVDFGGYVMADEKNPDSELGLNYSEFVGPLIKAVQELSARVRELEARLP
jgi:hypothetical protein